MIATRFAVLAIAASSVADPAKAQIMATKSDGAITTASVYALIMLTASVVAIIVGVATLLRSNKAARREAQKDADERTDKIMGRIDGNQRTTDDRLKGLEVKVTDFMPRSEIEQRIEHLKVNRVQIELRHDEKLKEISDCVARHGEQLAKVEERQNNTSAAVQRVEAMQVELGKDMRAGFEKLQDALHTRTATT